LTDQVNSTRDWVSCNSGADAAVLRLHREMGAFGQMGEDFGCETHWYDAAGVEVDEGDPGITFWFMRTLKGSL
jgi:hypothetical protein